MKIENGLGKFFGGPIIDLLSEFCGIMEAQSFSNLNHTIKVHHVSRTYCDRFETNYTAHAFLIAATAISLEQISLDFESHSLTC